MHILRCRKHVSLVKKTGMPHETIYFTYKNAVTKCLEFSWQMYTCHVTWQFMWDWHPVLVWVHCKWFSTSPMLLSLFSTCCRKIQKIINSRSRSSSFFQNCFLNIKCTCKVTVRTRYSENFQLEIRSCVAENIGALSSKRANHMTSFPSHKNMQ